MQCTESRMQARALRPRTCVPSRLPAPQAASTNSSTASFASQPLWRRCTAVAAPTAAANAAAAASRVSSGSASTTPSLPSPRGARATACRVAHAAPLVLALKAWRWKASRGPAAGIAAATAAAAAVTVPSKSPAAAGARAAWKAARLASSAPLCLHVQQGNKRASRRGLSEGRSVGGGRRSATGGMGTPNSISAPGSGEGASNEQRLFVQVAAATRERQQHKGGAAQGQQGPSPDLGASHSSPRQALQPRMSHDRVGSAQRRACWRSLLGAALHP